MLVDSPEKPAAEPRNRFRGFAFEEPHAEESHAAESPPPALVIAEIGSNAETSTSKAAESASRCPTPHLPPVEEQELDSPRSPSPPRPAASSSTRDASSAFSPRTASPSSRTPTLFPEYAADDAAAHAPYTSPQFEHRGDPSASSPAPQSSRTHIESSESARFAGAWCPPEPIVVLPRPPPRPLDPKRDAVAVVVATNTYTLAQSGRQIELVRRVLVHNGEKVLYDRRVEIRAPTLLNALEFDRTNRDDRAATLTPYSEVIRDLARHLPYCYCVFHDRAKTLAALRLALPSERSFDIGLHVHLRNDALRRGGRNVTRSRHRIVPLEDLWQPILGYAMPSVLQSQAAGILRIFSNIARTMGPTPQIPSTNYTPQLEWLTRGDVVHELSSSLLIEQRALETNREAPRESTIDTDELLPPKKGSAPFRFDVQRVRGIDLRRFETVNRMFAVAPHFGLAFLRLLVERDIVPASYATELANRQRVRLSVHDPTLAVFAININAPDAETVETAAAAFEEFLMLDDIKIAALAEACEFPEFEAVEIVRRA